MKKGQNFFMNSKYYSKAIFLVRKLSMSVLPIRGASLEKIGQVCSKYANPKSEEWVLIILPILSRML